MSDLSQRRPTSHLPFTQGRLWRAALVFFSLMAGLPACGSSPAVIAWHQGWQAEAAGDRDKAERKYARSAEDSALLGAACNRLRLLAARPDRKEEARELLDKLLKNNASAPEVAVTAALFALQAGDVKLARQRLDQARGLKAADPPALKNALQSAQVQVLLAEGRWQQAVDAGKDLPDEATAARQGAEIARWNAQSGALATVQLPAVTWQLPPEAQGPRLRAWLAAQRLDWATVRASLAELPDVQRDIHDRALLAWAMLQLGDVGNAQLLAADAARRDPQNVLAAEVWATTSLKTGNAAHARDVLAGMTVRGAGWSAWWNLGLAHLQLGDLPAALQAFDQAAVRCPQCPGVAQNRDALRKVVAR